MITATELLPALTVAWAPVLLQEENGDGAFGDATTAIIAVLGGLLLMFLIVRSTARRFASRHHREALEKIQSDEARDERRAEGRQRLAGKTRGDPEVERLFVELQDFTREVEGRLDTKILYLKGLIGEADRVAARLERLTDRAADVTPGGPSEPERDPSRPPGASQPEQEARGAGRAEPEPAEELGSRIDVTVDKGDPMEAADTAEKSTRVLELHAAGKPPRAIAEAVGLPKGEVELIINLHQSQSQPKTS